MDRFRQLWSLILEKVNVLNPSQRIAIGLCAALVFVSILWLLQWSTSPDLVPLVTHDFSFSQLDAAESSLKENGIDYEVVGTRLLVHSADRHNALRVLHAVGALPEGSLFDMAAMVADPNPFLAPEAREYAQNYARGNELAKIIGTSPFVKQASVLINPRSKRRLGGAPDVPTASVAITPAAQHELTEAMVDGFAKLVSGAVAGLKPHNVYVTDTRTGRTYNVPHPDDAVSLDAFSIEQKRESHLYAKIMSMLSDIPGVQVAVRVELDTSKRVTQRLKHDSPQPKSETTHSTENTSGRSAAEPGVQANLGQAITDSASSPSQTSDESAVENFEPKLSQTETVEQLPFAVKSTTAAVGIPRSFILGVFKARYPEKTDPKDDDPEFRTIRDEQVSRVRTSVGRLILAKTPNDVEVDVYPDMDWSASGATPIRAPGAVGLTQASAESGDPLSLAKTYGPQAGLAVLALMSLFMMLRIVRHAGPVKAEARASAEEGVPKGPEPLLTVGPHPVGQAEVSEGILTGREVDEETLRYRELGEEVSKLVEADPEGAANLIRRWIDQP